MTFLEKFVAFAEQLPPTQRRQVEAALAVLMEGHGAEYDFTADELTELDRRLAEPRPKFAAERDIDTLLDRAKPR